MITHDDINTLNFSADGLIPAVVADSATGAVLTLAYMNRESLGITLDEGYTCFWSRSRQELWRKGATSGNVQRVVDIRPDCENNSLLVLVEKAGPACHTGADSCFYADDDVPAAYAPGIADSLYALLRDRRENPKDGSYTTYLFNSGTDKILKKIGEESTEVIIAGKAGDRAETVYEIADLAYHVMVLMAHTGITPDEIRAELASRHVVDKKTKQAGPEEKAT